MLCSKQHRTGEPETGEHGGGCCSQQGARVGEILDGSSHAREARAVTGVVDKQQSVISDGGDLADSAKSLDAVGHRDFALRTNPDALAVAALIANRAEVIVVARDAIGNGEGFTGAGDAKAGLHAAIGGDGFSAPELTIVLPAGDTVDVNVGFEATTIGAAEGTLVVESDAQNTPALEIALSADAVEPLTCENSPCIARTFDPQLGVCVDTELEGPCDDGDACTVDTVCLDGLCVGVGAGCEAANACERGLCDPASGCVSLPDPEACDDGNPCTNDFCDEIDGCSHTEVEDGTLCAPGDRQALELNRASSGAAKRQNANLSGAEIDRAKGNRVARWRDQADKLLKRTFFITAGAGWDQREHGCGEDREVSRGGSAGVRYLVSHKRIRRTNAFFVKWGRYIHPRHPAPSANVRETLTPPENKVRGASKALTDGTHG